MDQQQPQLIDLPPERKQRPEQGVPHALSGTAFIRVGKDSPMWDMANLMYQRGDTNPLVKAIASSPAVVVYASVSQDPHKIFTVCQILWGGKLYTGVAKRLSYKGGDAPSELGIKLAFWRALSAWPIDLPANGQVISFGE